MLPCPASLRRGGGRSHVQPSKRPVDRRGRLSVESYRKVEDRSPHSCQWLAQVNGVPVLVALTP